jgi:phosphatidylglycerol:prolipoprotein diacylglycerol transferase
MIPYVELKTVPLGPLRVPAFGILLMTAIVVGRWRVLHLERADGRSDETRIALLCLVMLALGLTSAVVVRIATADFVALLTRPALALTERRGIMSVGGFYGGLVGGLIWCRLRRVSGFETLRMLDRIAFVLPVSWMIGRLGCALIHDHVGRASTSWLAVRFPSGPAYDLGHVGAQGGHCRDSHGARRVDRHGLPTTKVPVPCGPYAHDRWRIAP